MPCVKVVSTPGVKARSQMGRAAPMIGLLCIRGGAVLARLVLHTGSQKAGYQYIAMEVSSAVRASL